MISYLCTKERPQCCEFCKNDPSYECTHTSDLVYAKNWNHEPSEEELKEYFVRYGQHLKDPDWFEREVKNE